MKIRETKTIIYLIILKIQQQKKKIIYISVIWEEKIRTQAETSISRDNV